MGIPVSSVARVPVTLAQHTCAKGELSRFRGKGFLHGAAFGPHGQQWAARGPGPAFWRVARCGGPRDLHAQRLGRLLRHRLHPGEPGRRGPCGAELRLPTEAPTVLG